MADEDLRRGIEQPPPPFFLGQHRRPPGFRAGGHVSLRAARTEDALQGSAEADSGSLVTPLPASVR